MTNEELDAKIDELKETVRRAGQQWLDSWLRSIDEKAKRESRAECIAKGYPPELVDEVLYGGGPRD